MGSDRAGTPLPKPEAYRALVDAYGWKNTYVLSGGWGLVRADFCLPYYDVTFAPSVQRCNRRRPDDACQDFNHLAEATIGPKETIYFFGGLAYLPVYYDLTRDLPGRKVIYHTSDRIPREAGYEYIRYKDPFTNWHYTCVAEFIHGDVPR